jgi:tripartite-type tricarboxylate transporter receptor subunit TctC
MNRSHSRARDLAGAMLTALAPRSRGAQQDGEFIVPAGTGGADQMARLIPSIIAKHNLMKQPMVVVNKGMT